MGVQARNAPVVVNSGTGNSSGVNFGVNSGVNSADKFCQAELDSLTQIFEESFKSDFVKKIYTEEKFDFEGTMKALLVEVGKKESEKKSVEMETDSNPDCDPES